MLQTMRDNAQGIVAKIIVFFIIAVFALWGVESIVTLGGGEEAKASVGGNDINEVEIVRLVEQQKNNLRNQFGDQYNEDLFNEGFLRKSALEQLINQKVALVQADKLGLHASTSAIDAQIVSMPAFQLDGKFSKEQFQNILRMNGWSPLSFRNELAGDIKVNQARAAFVLSSVETPFSVQLEEALENETRSFRFVELNSASLEKDIEVSDEEIESFYGENKSRFMTDETVSIDYVQLERGVLAAKQAVSDEDVDLLYQDYVAKEKELEQRDSSHILIEISDDITEEDAQKLAADIKQRLDNGEDFAELASQFSDDIGTKAQGGKLGLNTRGAFVEEFENALYGLSTGEVSAPVKTEFGYHIIKLNKVAAADVKSLDEMKEQLEADVRAEKAEVEFAELQQELSNIAFSAGSIEEVADALSLDKQSTALFSRNYGDGVASNNEIRTAAFQDNILLDREISGVIETAAGALVFAINEYKPSELKALNLVKSGIVAELTSTKAKDVAKDKAETIKNGDVTDVQWTQVETSFNQSSDAPRSVQQKAFEMAEGQSAVVSTPGGYSVVMVEGVIKKDWQSMQTSESLIEQGRTQHSRADMVSYQVWAKENVEIKRSGS